jgi:hypothetical protein
MENHSNNGKNGKTADSHVTSHNQNENRNKKLINYKNKFSTSTI